MVHLLLIIIYLAFISLGLPDSLLGSAWPLMHQEMGVNLSFAGIVSTIIAAGTIISSLQSDRLTKKMGTGKVTAFSVLMTAIALLGFSKSSAFYMLCLWAIPYGLGAGSIDASLNNYVALHFKSHHMSWLHCMWGVGAAIGPYIMGWAITNAQGWQGGYLSIALIQVILAVILFMALPLWREKTKSENFPEEFITKRPLTLKEIYQLPGAKSIMLSFFCYSAIEQTTGLWASSFLVENKAIDPKIAASYAALFFIGITIGRALSGFLTFCFSDEQMIRLGSMVLTVGVLLMLAPFGGEMIALMSLVLIGLGCAPIYPSIIHMSPRYFGKEKSQAIIGVQMASAYVGTLIMPPLFGVISSKIGMEILPFYLVLLLIVMFWMSEKFIKNKPVEEF